MLDRLSVKAPAAAAIPDARIDATDAAQVQARFWQHLLRLSEPARRLWQIRKALPARHASRSLPLEGLL